MGAFTLPLSADPVSGDRMESSGPRALLDSGGSLLSARIQRVLRDILPRFRHRFPALGDELLVTEVLEEAGRRIAEHERGGGQVENLDAYAWVTVLNVARSRLRRSSMRLARATLGSDEGQAILGTLRSSRGTPEQIEADILLKEVFALLTPEEQWLCNRKQLGCSSREIAGERGTSVARVNILFYRIKRKIRASLCGSSADAAVSRNAQPSKTRTA